MSDKLNIVTLSRPSLVEKLTAVKANLEGKIAASKDANTKAFEGKVTFTLTGLSGVALSGKAPKVELGNASELVNNLPRINNYLDLLDLSTDPDFVVSRQEAAGIAAILKLGELEVSKEDYELTIGVRLAR